MYCSDAPVFGTRTWGGLVGNAGGPPLMDGGFVGAPSSGIYNPLSGEWEVENIGVAPDIEVEQDPALVSKRGATRNWRRRSTWSWRNSRRTRRRYSASGVS
jgi:C-terminal processing protease CtpA/Prc